MIDQAEILRELKEIQAQAIVNERNDRALKERTTVLIRKLEDVSTSSNAPPGDTLSQEIAERLSKRRRSAFTKK